ncbi:MAG TPA: hypothetical protein VGM88_08970 [Kofleriaceae bacterium]
MERLDNWTAEGRASLEGDRMTLTELGRSFAMKPAVHFVRASGSDHDPNDLVGRVKSKDALQEMGADQFDNSVIYQDTAYDVVDGFIGEPLFSSQTLSGVTPVTGPSE